MTKDQVYSSRPSGVRPSEVTVANGSKFIGATFLYLALALLITFATVGGMGALFNFALNDGSEASAAIFMKVLIASIVLYIPVMIWVHIAAARGGKTTGPAFFLYSIVLGVMISPLCVLLDFWTIIIAFGTTCLAFGLMALIAWGTKKNLSTLAVIAFGLIIGALIISLVNLILTLVGVGSSMYWLVSFLFFAAIMLLTIVDLNHVKQIAMSGYGTKNLALLCALNLYVDFIYIFIRLLMIIASIRGK